MIDDRKRLRHLTAQGILQTIIARKDDYLGYLHAASTRQEYIALAVKMADELIETLEHTPEDNDNGE